LLSLRQRFSKSAGSWRADGQIMSAYFNSEIEPDGKQRSEDSDREGRERGEGGGCDEVVASCPELSECPVFAETRRHDQVICGGRMAARFSESEEAK
jgi:hypothetical protein